MAALAQWHRALGFPFPLLCDADRAVALAYGAAESADQAKAARVSVLIGRDGRVLRHYAPADPGTHADDVLADLRALEG